MSLVRRSDLDGLLACCKTQCLYLTAAHSLTTSHMLGFPCLQESPTWPALVECCAAAGVRLALLNARLSSRLFLAWFGSMPRRALLGRMLGSFNLIVPQSDIVSGAGRAIAAVTRVYACTCRVGGTAGGWLMS